MGFVLKINILLKMDSSVCVYGQTLFSLSSLSIIINYKFTKLLFLFYLITSPSAHYNDYIESNADILLC